MLLPSFAVCLYIRFLSLRRSALHLPSVVALYASDSLFQTICTTVLVIWMGCFVLVEYDTGSRCRILRIMNKPEMPGIPAHDCHIKSICENDGEILRIQIREIICIKHRPYSLPDPSHIQPAAPPQTVHAIPSSLS